MRLALLSDIHGNSVALDAVLADVEMSGGADAYWVLGDLAAIGHDPVGVVERLVALPNVRFVRGNADRYVATGERPPPTTEEVRRDPSLLEQFFEVAGTFAWTQGALAAGGWFGWLAELPLEQRLTLPDGTRLLGVHAAPGRDDGPGIHRGLSDAELAAILEPSDADLVFVGHTHVALDRVVGGVRVINLGSVSNPATADLRASYAILQATASGYRVEMHRVDYDREAVITAVEQLRHPGGRFISRQMRGEVRSQWAQD